MARFSTPLRGPFAEYTPFFAGMRCLRRINLSENQLEGKLLFLELASLKNLEQLNLNKNRLTVSCEMILVPFEMLALETPRIDFLSGASLVVFRAQFRRSSPSLWASLNLTLQRINSREAYQMFVYLPLMQIPQIKRLPGSKLINLAGLGCFVWHLLNRISES